MYPYLWCSTPHILLKPSPYLPSFSTITHPFGSPTLIFDTIVGTVRTCPMNVGYMSPNESRLNQQHISLNHHWSPTWNVSSRLDDSPNLNHSGHSDDVIVTSFEDCQIICCLLVDVCISNIIYTYIYTHMYLSWRVATMLLGTSIQSSSLNRSLHAPLESWANWGELTHFLGSCSTPKLVGFEI